LFKRKVKIIKIKKDQKIETEDTVLIENSIDLIVNSESLVNIMCLPKDLKELAVGFLYSIGIINSIKDVKEIRIEELENKIYVDLSDSIDFKMERVDIKPVSRIIDTTCGIPSPWRNLIKDALEEAKNVFKSDDIKIAPELIYSSLKQMQKEPSLFKETGGCHSAAIFDLNGKMLSFKEDVGRHNAIDKVIGEMLLKEQNLKNVILTSTGRLTGDSVLKAIRAEIPILASLSAAIESGVRLAFAYGITLIGFVRGARMNVYTHPYRIKI